MTNRPKQRLSVCEATVVLSFLLVALTICWQGRVTDWRSLLDCLTAALVIALYLGGVFTLFAGLLDRLRGPLDSLFAPWRRFESRAKPRTAPGSHRPAGSLQRDYANCRSPAPTGRFYTWSRVDMHWERAMVCVMASTSALLKVSREACEGAWRPPSFFNFTLKKSSGRREETDFQEELASRLLLLM